MRLDPISEIALRDEMPIEDAEEFIDDVKDEMMDLIASGRFQDAEDLFSDSTGLEPDYILDMF
jgi:hypothetical protein